MCECMHGEKEPSDTTMEVGVNTQCEGLEYDRLYCTQKMTRTPSQKYEHACCVQWTAAGCVCVCVMCECMHGKKKILQWRVE